jgi:hypothetical protein
MAGQKQQTAIPSFKFHHLHMYVDDIKPLEEYKTMEQSLNSFAKSYTKGDQEDKCDCAAGTKSWTQVTGKTVDPSKYISQGQDLVTQLLHGVGWRVVGEHIGSTTRSMCVRSVDQCGVQFIITCKSSGEPSEKKQKTGGKAYDHFNASHLTRFADAHGGKQGIAVLSFELGTGGLDTIYSRYKRVHPKLIASGEIMDYPEDGFRVLEVFAYYKGDKQVTDADSGTIIRFLEIDRSKNVDNLVLPGFSREKAEYDSTCLPAYCDHWVSNVVSREGFLDTLNDTLGFTPKVDFNAGVVAAGEAQIESTVTGNSTTLETVNTAEALVDQSQVYLPINNALSSVGHVHWFLEELGQGVQHIASRVKDLPSFIQRANDYRTMTGEGFSFLNIPRSYYGRLAKADLEEKAELTGDTADMVMQALMEKNLMDMNGIVKLDISDEEASDALLCIESERTPQTDKIASVIKASRYCNLYKLLKDHLDEKAYLKIVRNKILVDIQGGDLLYQIFTSCVLQRNGGEEAPFLEFIQRLCSDKKNEDGTCKPIKPGCGGFGIRNFLTLFLSIEVSKAMREIKEARARGDAEAAAKAEKQVAIFGSQLDESNPILTQISDAMTLEGEYLEAAGKASSEEQKAKFLALVEEQKKVKGHGQDLLKECSLKYKNLMKALRE